MNVARNARQAGAQHLRFRTRLERDAVVGPSRHPRVIRVDLQDDGPGVPAPIRPLVFFPMVTGRRDGSGLGLALAQSIAIRHDGLITFESEPGSREIEPVPALAICCYAQSPLRRRNRWEPDPGKPGRGSGGSYNILFFRIYFALVKVSPTRKNARKHAPWTPARGERSTEFSTDFVDKGKNPKRTVTCNRLRRKALNNVS